MNNRIGLKTKGDLYRNKTAQKKRELIFSFLIVTIILLYILIWSTISLLKFYSLNSYVYDLGLNMERGWYFIYSPWTWAKIELYLTTSVVSIILSPLFIFKSFPLLLVFQTSSLAFASLFVFLIAKEKIRDLQLSLLLAVSFLLSPGVVGLNWYDFHFQSFFLILFLSAFYFYIRQKWLVSGVLFIVSGLVRFPYVIFPLLFSIIEMTSWFIEGRQKKNYVLNRKFQYALLIFSISCLFFILSYTFRGGVAGIETFVNVSPTYDGGFLHEINNKILAILILFGPLFFLPLFSKRWILFMVPFFYLVFFSNSYGEYFPFIFQHQGAAIILPFIYLGAIDVLQQIKIKTFKIPILKFLKKNKKLLFSLMLVSILVLASFMEPFSPLNKYSGNNYYYSYYVNYNSTKYKALSSVEKLIPPNASGVIVQNNLPQLYPRPTEYLGWYVLAPGINVFSNNISISDIKNNEFPVENYNSSISYLKIMYVIADINSPYFTFNNTGYTSMLTVVNSLLKSQIYGIYAEEQGIILLKRNYVGPPIEYHPLEQSLNSNLFVTTKASFHNGTLISLRNSAPLINTTLLYGPFINLPPGNYQITYYLHLKSSATNNTLLFQVTSNFGNELISQTMYKPSINCKNETIEIKEYFNLNYFTANIQFPISTVHWIGNFNFIRVDVLQTGTL